MTLTERQLRIESLLMGTAPLWQASTFRERRPAWCLADPTLTNALLSLDERTLAIFSGDSAQAFQFLTPALPVLKSLAMLTDFPGESSVSEINDCSRRNPCSSSMFGAKANRDIPGRKIGQIDAFVAAVGQPQAPLVEWCAGKGHLGRRFQMTWGGEVLAVERNPNLCASGEVLARGMRQTQRFLTADVMVPSTAETLRGAHAVALHACGDLHRRLIKAAADVRAPAIDVAPCCYQLTADDVYRPLQALSALTLNRIDLKLAVTETVTASPREAADSAQASAWKLAFLNLREQSMGDRQTPVYQPFRPVPAAWLRESFVGFIGRLAAREGLSIPSGLDFSACEAAGWQRHDESRRLQLVRMAFRRAIEVWLLCDLASWLERQAYAVTLREFCARTLTPRNLLLSARLL